MLCILFYLAEADAVYTFVFVVDIYSSIVYISEGLWEASHSADTARESTLHLRSATGKCCELEEQQTAAKYPSQMQS